MKDLQLEEDLIYRYNGKKIKEMPYNFRFALMKHFSREDGILDFSKADSYSKGRIVITCGEKRLFLSVKSDSRFSIHKESLLFFLNFLRDINLTMQSKELLKEQLFCFSKPEKEFFLSKNKFFLNEVQKDIDNHRHTFLYRYLFKGAKSTNPVMDALYFEDSDTSFLLLREEIERHLFSKKDFLLNFSPFQYEFDKENLNVKFFWKSMKEDGLKILKENQ